MSAPETTPIEDSGVLVDIGVRKLGQEAYQYWRCCDCGTDFANRCCNGKQISACPWCFPDSRPWTNGRGL